MKRKVLKHDLIETQFARWDESLDADLDTYGSSAKEESAFVELRTGLTCALNEMFSAIRECAAPKAEWEASRVMHLPTLTEVSNRLLDTRCVFVIFATDEEIGLQTRLYADSAIPSVDDKFWLELASIFQHGTVRVDEECFQFPVTSKPGNAHLIKKSSSVFFSIMRQFILCTQEDQDPQYGGIKVTWPRGTPCAEMFPGMVASFGSFYKMERMLQRIIYLRTRQTVKTFMKQEGLAGTVQDHMPRRYFR